MQRRCSILLIPTINQGHCRHRGWQCPTKFPTYQGRYPISSELHFPIGYYLTIQGTPTPHILGQCGRCLNPPPTSAAARGGCHVPAVSYMRESSCIATFRKRDRSQLDPNPEVRTRFRRAGTITYSMTIPPDDTLATPRQPRLTCDTIEKETNGSRQKTETRYIYEYIYLDPDLASTSDHVNCGS